MRSYLIVALGLMTLGASFTYVPPAFAAKISCSKSCYCPLNKNACQQLCQARYERCLELRRNS
jgi:hypothetical protein